MEFVCVTLGVEWEGQWVRVWLEMSHCRGKDFRNASLWKERFFFVLLLIKRHIRELMQWLIVLFNGCLRCIVSLRGRRKEIPVQQRGGVCAHALPRSRVYMYVRRYVRALVYLCEWCAFEHVCHDTCVWECVCVCMCVCISVCVYVCVRVRVLETLCVQLYVFVCVSVYGKCARGLQCTLTNVMHVCTMHTHSDMIDSTHKPKWGGNTKIFDQTNTRQKKWLKSEFLQKYNRTTLSSPPCPEKHEACVASTHTHTQTFTRARARARACVCMCVYVCMCVLRSVRKP